MGVHRINRSSSNKHSINVRVLFKTKQMKLLFGIGNTILLVTIVITIHFVLVSRDLKELAECAISLIYQGILFARAVAKED